MIPIEYLSLSFIEILTKSGGKSDAFIHFAFVKLNLGRQGNKWFGTRRKGSAMKIIFILAWTFSFRSFAEDLPGGGEPKTLVAIL